LLVVKDSSILLCFEVKLKEKYCKWFSDRFNKNKINVFGLWLSCLNENNKLFYPLKVVTIVACFVNVMDVAIY